jgi:cyclopropane fatty-acyl-phospholipid synthase-like methyltransferase
MLTRVSSSIFSVPKPKVLEIASGFGETISYIANSHPHMVCVPSDAQAPCLDRLRELAAIQSNLSEPLELNVFVPSHWNQVSEQGPFDGILIFNLIHMIPSNGVASLLKQASQLLEQNHGFLAIHGPFLREGSFMSASDQDFDNDIKSRDPQWGLRDLDEILCLASEYNFKNEQIVEMRVGNWMLILRQA